MICVMLGFRRTGAEQSEVSTKSQGFWNLITLLVLDALFHLSQLKTFTTLDYKSHPAFEYSPFLCTRHAFYAVSMVWECVNSRHLRLLRTPYSEG
jgi:hypothetical protein